MLQLRAEGIELRDRETVLRASVGGKVNVSCECQPQHICLRQKDFSSFVNSIMHERIKAFRQSLDKPAGKQAQLAPTQAFGPYPLSEFL